LLQQIAERIKAKRLDIKALAEEAIKQTEEKLLFFQSKLASIPKEEILIREEWARILPNILAPDIDTKIISVKKKIADILTDRQQVQKN
jgi:hypothetical protein